ncbi:MULTISPECIES: alanine/glycine:cation symporter family protein [unclassified Corynebacterium]|uniref:alanine/glycine:cation symporter family protein n=1 Tax=Corynebacterium rhinophilum TaxID=3050197 RepID=UPI00254BA07F|nr:MULTISPECIES: alanine/glycine:cation symporter family protein [unclassified Corynebacterium]MDK8702896.1 alanine/glycine:cation symporter family protein [Corynebacterium sp. MSK107]MDK8705635.1 alanine/glycine:cation symporter family protein [Corynebacterium sp. MSK090]MDK8831470.1 alanine/glycine:cation symporter family protein [Corynebacterium sp. MSK072]
MANFLDALNSIIWSPALVFLCLGAGVYFTVVTRGLQVRCLPDMLRQISKGEKSDDGVSSFQSLMVSLSGRVGVGNIAGVSTAIAFGGPGAVFWMWAVALLGSSTSFIECTLAQIYKEKDQDTGEYRGGPAYYIEKAYKHTKAAPFMMVYGILFAIAMILATSYFLPGIQANAVAAAADTAWGINSTWAAVVLAGILAIIIIGGVKRIANFATLVVPFMAVIYIGISIVVMLINYSQIPEVFGLIFKSAFNLEAGFSGMLGVAIMWGVKRGIYSNEAGQGTGPQSAAAAEVSHPAKQGFVQSFAVYIDTLFVCSATAFMIISTDMYTVFRGESEAGEVVYQGSLPDDVAVGPGFVQSGLDSVFSGWGPTFIAVSIAFFAFTTVLAYYYMSEVNLTYFNRWVKSRPIRRGLVWALRILIIVSVIVGATTTPGSAWALGDIGVGTTAWLNIIAILFLQVPALKVLKDYEKQKKAGKEPEFDPEAVGIKNADFWVDRKNARAAAQVAGSQAAGKNTES